MVLLALLLKPPYPQAAADQPYSDKQFKQVVKQAEVAPPAPQPAPVQETQPEPEPVQPPAVGVTNCGDNPYKQYIYQHESGCRTDAVNSIGCAGLGQACPGSKLPCSLTDWACQDNYFTNYATQRYGSWEAAYAFWVANRWW